jgi:hypothetical protein
MESIAAFEDYISKVGGVDMSGFSKQVLVA